MARHPLTPTRLHFPPMPRLTRLDQKADLRRDGTPRTVADAICDHLASGMLVDQAAALVGVSRPAIYEWLRTGAQLRQRNTPRRDMTKAQRLAAEFHQAAELALAECERRDIAALNTLAAGGIRVSTTTETVQLLRDADGVETDLQVVERRTVTKTLPPDLRAITWRLQRRWPERYFQPETVVNLPSDAGPGMDPATAALEEARRMVEREREVRAALPAGVVDAVVIDERPLRLDDDQ